MDICIGNDEVVVFHKTVGRDDDQRHLGQISANSALFPTDIGWIRVENLGEDDLMVTVCEYVDGKKGEERILKIKYKGKYNESI